MMNSETAIRWSFTNCYQILTMRMDHTYDMYLFHVGFVHFSNG